MATSEARKRANAKWDKQNMTIIAAKVRNEVKEAFRAACEQNGTTMNAVLLEAMRSYIEQHKPD